MTRTGSEESDVRQLSGNGAGNSMALRPILPAVFYTKSIAQRLAGRSFAPRSPAPRVRLCGRSRRRFASCAPNREVCSNKPAAERTGLHERTCGTRDCSPPPGGAAAGCRCLRRRACYKISLQQPLAAGRHATDFAGSFLHQINRAAIGGPQPGGGGGPQLLTVVCALRRLQPERQF